MSTPNHDVVGSDLWAIGWPWTTFTILATFGLADKLLEATSQNYCVADSESFCVESWCEDDKTHQRFYFAQDREVQSVGGHRQNFFSLALHIFDTHLFWKGKGSHSSWSIIFLPHFFVCKTTLIKTWDSLAFILLKVFLWVAEVRITIYNRQIISFFCGLLVFSVFFCNRHFLSFWCIFPAVFWRRQRWGWHFTTDISFLELSGDHQNDILSTHPPIPSIGKYLPPLKVKTSIFKI